MGTLKSTANTFSAPGMDRRYHRISLYKTKERKWVVHIEYLTEWRSERPWSTVFYDVDRDTVVSSLKEYNPLDDVNLPPGKKYDTLVKEVEGLVELAWRSAVSEVLTREFDKEIS